jgi:drug/metabolite transporter superfamily protein YnfA
MSADKSFEQLTRERHEGSFLIELWSMMRQHRKFWLIPIVIILLLFGLLVSLSGTAVAPFIYTLF